MGFRFEQQLTQTLKHVIGSPTNELEQAIMLEQSFNLKDLEDKGPFVKQTPLIPKNMKLLSKIVKIDEHYEHNFSFTVTKTARSPAERTEPSLPIEVHCVYLVGYNHSVDEAKSVSKPPQVLASHSVKLAKSGLEQHAEAFVKRSCFPDGIKFQRFGDIVQTLIQLRKSLRYELIELEQVEEHSFEDQAPFVVSMLRSTEDACSDKFVMISQMLDFNLQKLDAEQSKKYNSAFAVVSTEVAIAVEFDSLQFKSVEKFLTALKIKYLTQRIEQISDILLETQSEEPDLSAHFGGHYESFAALCEQEIAAVKLLPQQIDD